MKFSESKSHSRKDPANYVKGFGIYPTGHRVAAAVAGGTADGFKVREGIIQFYA